ncbi:hypothetical protein AURANDRAFT_59582 [Aureococcus anophagefferens]|uniref:DM10 domain-containing protein n=1 Tax=Aureococcus anophagefferens TaxID=44056 RepID=F0YM77_AURAN|nr:hypothetical protein AURANDRAFT_59582 [Aureococcus anophagefferens]EGB03788.1 hypothetical protein AURANDRAFT_59582 [Aureococcus anophagefferens]|eukprot:XP_009041518.1 hypothetical protein AURANDRAFT_59582 [Aureococcus anophagefferens]
MAVYGLSVEWYDAQPMLTREFVMRVYAEELQVEMYDANSRRTFLKKSPLPSSIRLNDLHVGNEIVLHSRALKIVRYADRATAMALSKSQIVSTVLLTPECIACRKLGAAISMLEDAGLTIKKLKMVALNKPEADKCLQRLHKRPNEGSQLSSNKCVIASVAGTDAVEALTQACRAISESLGARFGSNCTCCVVRPHAVMGKQLGAILSHIEALQAYEISAMALFKLDIPAAAEFLEIYEGVIPEFEASVKQLSSGPCCALELRTSGTAVQHFRESCGPWDVNFAKEIRPQTIRAKFGIDGVKNAVHCTDLPDDGESEVRYFFEILNPC